MPVVRLDPRSTRTPHRTGATRYASALLLAGTLASAACGDGAASRAGGARQPAAPAPSAASPGPTSPLVDDFGDTVRLAAPPSRIVSLTPATTELLFAIGAGSRLVGRTTWDTWPAEARAVPDLGAGIRPNVEAVLGARPDLVLLYASGDNRAAAQRLRALGVPTASYKVDRIADFQRVTLALGQLTGEAARARDVVDSVRATLDRVRARTAPLRKVSLVFPLWDSPLLVAGGGSFLTELVEIAGGRNVYAGLPAPSPQVAFEDLVRRDPDAVLTGPLPARRYAADARWRALRAVREGRILVVDTMLVIRPAARLGEAAESIARLLHPDIAP